MKDGGQAFPSEEVFDERVVGMHPGMTMRQWYKGQVLQGLITFTNGERLAICFETLAKRRSMEDYAGDETPEDYFAQIAGRLADAMLAEDAQHEKEA